MDIRYHVGSVLTLFSAEYPELKEYSAKSIFAYSRPFSADLLARFN